MLNLKQSENSRGAGRTDTKQKAGFAVLFSVMLASFLITLGISIFSISLKEIQITTSVRDSQVAYYAADSARECALYADVKLGAFPACIDSACTEFFDINGDTVLATSPRQVNVTCNNIPATLTFTKTGTTYTSQKLENFFKASTLASAPASDIRITKQFIPATSLTKTTIETWGHNTQILGRRVERGISQTNN